MKNLPIIEISTSSILIIILLLFLTPSELLMPQGVEMMLILLLILVFLVFSSVVWKEQAADERENMHRLNAGRVSFLVGSLVILIGVVVQAFSHDIDQWLVIALIAMVLSKIISRLISQIRN